MAKSLHNRWKDLGRNIHLNVRNNPDQYSLIYLSNPFVVPGGRFRECYYWDSYWTILGLLVSGMQETAKGMTLYDYHLVTECVRQMHLCTYAITNPFMIQECWRIFQQ